MSGVVEKYPAMYGTAGVYMSSDSGVMNDDAARSAMRPPVRRRRLRHDEPFPYARQLPC